MSWLILVSLLRRVSLSCFSAVMYLILHLLDHWAKSLRTSSFTSQENYQSSPEWSLGIRTMKHCQFSKRCSDFGRIQDEISNIWLVSKRELKILEAKDIWIFEIGGIICTPNQNTKQLCNQDFIFWLHCFFCLWGLFGFGGFLFYFCFWCFFSFILCLQSYLNSPYSDRKKNFERKLCKTVKVICKTNFKGDKKKGTDFCFPKQPLLLWYW